MEFVENGFVVVVGSVSPMLFLMLNIYIVLNLKEVANYGLMRTPKNRVDDTNSKCARLDCREPSPQFSPASLPVAQPEVVPACPEP